MLEQNDNSETMGLKTGTGRWEHKAVTEIRFVRRVVLFGVPRTVLRTCGCSIFRNFMMENEGPVAGSLIPSLGQGLSLSRGLSTWLGYHTLSIRI